MSICIDPGYGAANGPCAILSQINTYGIFLRVCCEQDKAASYQVLDNGDCVSLMTLAHEQHVSIGPADAGQPDFQGFQSHLRLRGNGDIAAYGGNEADGVYAVAKLGRRVGQEGAFEYINSCLDLALCGAHYWYNLERPSNLTQDLMKLEPAAATLYFPGWVFISDDGLKSNIAPIDCPACCAAVKNIVPVSYVYNPNGETYQGFTYSNLTTAYPAATTTVTLKTSIGPGGEEGSTPVTQEIGAIRTNDLLAALVGAVKDIITRVEALEAV